MSDHEGSLTVKLYAEARTNSALLGEISKRLDEQACSIRTLNNAHAANEVTHTAIKAEVAAFEGKFMLLKKSLVSHYSWDITNTC